MSGFYPNFCSQFFSPLKVIIDNGTISKVLCLQPFNYMGVWGLLIMSMSKNYPPTIPPEALTVDYVKSAICEIVDECLKEKGSYKHYNCALTALSEASKVLGAYAPEKTINQNLNLSADGDIKELMDLRAKMLEEKRKEY